MLDILQLQWEQINITHIARHDVTLQEVEEVCRNQPITSESYQGRIRLIGATAGGRILTVILAAKGSGIYYPVTARSASRKERQIYNQQKGGVAA